MSNFKLCAGDILVNFSTAGDPWPVIRRWAIGPYFHCFMYMGVLRFGATRYRACAGRVPMLFESNGRGVCLRMLSERYGEEVVVMRLNKYRRRIPRVLREAIKLASDPQSYYDYYVIFWHLIPRIIYSKLGLNPPLKYQRDERQICSEALLEICLRAGVPVLPDDIVPLPGDFATDSCLLYPAWSGILTHKVV